MNKKKRSRVNILRILLEDHDLFRRNFKNYENLQDQMKRKIFEDTLRILVIHAKLEEELIYPLIKPIKPDMVNEGIEEHHAANLLIDELKDMNSDDTRFDKKFHVLGEIVIHHLEEEEKETLPILEKINVDLDSLGIKFEKRKFDLMKQFTKPEELCVNE